VTESDRVTQGAAARAGSAAARAGGAAAPGRRIVLATRNAGKLVELHRILAASGIDVTLAGLGEFPGAPEVAETGRTFADNALLKARSAAAFTGLPAVADDSGLCVDALNGMPGVLSARWAGRHGDDQANVDLVLAQLTDVPDADRGAYFACAAALVVPAPSAGEPACGEPAGGAERVVEGRLYGRISRAPRGTNGFGYDPVFVPDSSDLTTAEMDPAAKDAISHRARALRALAPVIAELLGA
jgi:XTP/dITP diphosphohydrolase